MTITKQPLVLAPDAGDFVQIGQMGVRFMIDGERSGGGFSLVEHPIAPRALAAPMHVHEHEDEYSYVLAGEVGVQVGDEVRYAKAGDLVFKPRGVWHAFWNRADEPARLLEIISPAGFEAFFSELVDLGGVAGARPEQLGALCERFALEMDPSSVPDLIRRFGVRFPAEPLA